MKNNRSKVERKKRRREILAEIYSALIYLLFYLPIAVLMAFSFNDAERNYYWQGFTTRWYEKLFSFTNTTLWDALFYSLIIAIIVTIISLIIGVLGGIGLSKFNFKMKSFVSFMIYVPIIVPEIVLAVSFLIIFITVGAKLGMASIIMGHCIFCIPYTVVTIKGRISGDNEVLEEASMDLGANRWQTFVKVTIPNIMPGIISAAFLSFTLSFDDVITSNLLAGARQSTLPVLILSMNRTGITPDVNALVTVMIVFMVLGLLAVNFYRKRRAKALVKKEMANN